MCNPDSFYMKIKCHRVNLFYAFILLTVIISCKSQEGNVTSNIWETLNNHLTLEHKNSTGSLDSFRIIKIDSFSSKKDLSTRIDSFQNLLSLEFFKLEKLETLLKLRAISLDNLKKGKDVLSNDSIENTLKKGILSNSIYVLKHKLDSLVFCYNSGKVDSTNFLYYRVQYRLCYSYKNIRHNCKDSLYLFVTKDFKVKGA